MPSPFPGMDPYIEGSGRWPDFHVIFLAACQEWLLAVLPPGYDAQINEQVRLVDLSAETPWPPQRYWPDLALTRDPNRVARSAPAGGGDGGGSVATLEPLALDTPDYVEVRERWIEVRGQPDADLVTAIELLSPSNKVNPGFGEHQAKRAALVHANVNVLELDLLTGGGRPELNPPLPDVDFAALLFRADRRPKCAAFVWGVRDPLPTVPVPLRSAADEVPLDLARAFTTAYDRRRYGRHLPYDRRPNVRLADVDLQWAMGIAGKASGTAAE